MRGHPRHFNPEALAAMGQGPRPQQIPTRQGMQPEGFHYDPSRPDEIQLPDQDLVNAMYDIFGSYPRKNVLPYAYQWNFSGSNALGAGATGRASIKVSADAAFNSVYMTGTSSGAYTIFMRTDSSDRQLMDDPIHSATAVGTAERPLILPKPLLLAPNTTLSFTIVDLSAATNTIYFTLWGFKVYRRQYAMAG